MELYSDLLVSDDVVWFPLPNLKTGGDTTNPFSKQTVEWGIHSPDGKVLSEFTRKAEQRKLNKISAFAKRGSDALDAGELIAEGIDKAVAATAGWRNLPDKDGNDVPFSAETAREIYLNPKSRWIADWVVGLVNDRGNFAGRDEPAGPPEPTRKK